MFKKDAIFSKDEKPLTIQASIFQQIGRNSLKVSELHFGTLDSELRVDNLCLICPLKWFVNSPMLNKTTDFDSVQQQVEKFTKSLVLKSIIAFIDC